MKRPVGAVCLSAFLSAALFLPLDPSFAGSSKTKITILSENTSCGDPKIKTEVGFCVLIEKDGKQYLYDAGRSAVCVENARALGKDLGRTEKIFLSHGHLDHTGGLEALLKAIGHPVEIYAHPDIFEDKVRLDDSGHAVAIGMPFTREYLEKKYGVVFRLHRELFKVADSVWLTGEVPFSDRIEKIPAEASEMVRGRIGPDPLRDDNSVVIKTDKGLIVILGCGHRGIINILTHVKKNFHGKIAALIGGTHLQDVNREQMAFVKSSLERIFRDDQTRLFAPTHCTGVSVEQGFKAEFKDIFESASCGSSMEF